MRAFVMWVVLVSGLISTPAPEANCVQIGANGEKCFESECNTCAVQGCSLAQARPSTA